MKIPVFAATLLLIAPAAQAVVFDWADWTSSTGGTPFIALGTITTDTATVGGDIFQPQRRA